jgi:hypothetical protein
MTYAVAARWIPTAIALALACKGPSTPAFTNASVNIRPPVSPAPSTTEPSSAAPPSPSITGDALDWYPLTNGSTWLYSATTESVTRLGNKESHTSKPGSVTDRCLGPSPEEPDIVLLERQLEERVHSLGTSKVVTTVQRLSISADSIRALSIQNDGVMPVPYAAPYTLFSLAPKGPPGTQTINYSLHLDVAPVSLSSESVQTPAGEYPDALKQVVRGTVRGSLGIKAVKSGTVVENTWFVRGIGPVKVERTLSMEVRIGSVDAPVTEVSTRALVEYSR